MFTWRRVAVVVAAAGLLAVPPFRPPTTAQEHYLLGTHYARRGPKYRCVVEPVAGSGPEKLGMRSGGADGHHCAGKNGSDPQCVLRIGFGSVFIISDVCGDAGIRRQWCSTGFPVSA